MSHANTALTQEIRNSLEKAAEYAWSIQKEDGLFVGEVELNAGPTAQAILIEEALRLRFPETLRAKARNYILRTQRPADGGWSTAPGLEADVSVSLECYVALRILGEPSDAPVCVRARKAIRNAGGIKAANPWTQLYLGVLGVIPWDQVGKVPIETLLLPEWSGLSIDPCAYWVKVITPAMMLVGEVGPGAPSPLAPTIRTELEIDSTPRFLPRILGLFRIPALRKRGIQKAWKRIASFTEENGDFGGNTCTAVNVLIALDRTGRRSEPVFENGLKAFLSYGIETEKEWRLQTCQSHVWDTGFMLCALSAFSDGKDPRALPARAALLDRQIREIRGDWARNVPVDPGAWCFGNRHDHYPVTDCTAISLLALTHHEPRSVGSEPLTRGVRWLLGMQNEGGGWSAYEKFSPGWLDRFIDLWVGFKDIPNALRDVPKADVSSKVLEALAEFLIHAEKFSPSSPLLDPVRASLEKGREYLLSTRDRNSLWKGNYGVNYLYGTAFAAKALRAIDSALRRDRSRSEDWAEACREFFLKAQNPDGGWGETDRSYSDPSLRGQGPSSPVQSSWALIGLCSSFDDSSAKILDAIQKGARYLLSNQRRAGPWEEPRFLGTVFPEKVYFRYELYPVYFPMMALAATLEVVDEAEGRTPQS